MAEIDFDFYGVRARLSSESKESLSELARDFAWFRTEEKANPDIRLTLIFAEPPSQRSPAGNTAPRTGAPSEPSISRAAGSWCTIFPGKKERLPARILIVFMN
jgi:hypothetical protein